MSRLTLVLVATAIFFATTAVHAYRHLPSQPGGAMQEVFPPVPGVEPRVSMQRAPQDAGPASPEPEVETSGAAAVPDPGSQALKRYRLALLQDPATRAQRIREYVALLRFGGWEVEGPNIGMSAAEIDEYLQARAGLIAQRQEALLTCQLNPGCDDRAVLKTQRDDARSDDLMLLGPHRHERLRDYRTLAPHLVFARLFDAQLENAHRMDDATIERLARIFQQEQLRIQQQAERQGLHQRTVTNGELAVLITTSPHDEHPRLAESIREQGRRLLDLVQRVMTDVQFEQFSRMFEPQLDELVAIHGDPDEMEVRRLAMEAAGTP